MSLECVWPSGDGRSRSISAAACARRRAPIARPSPPPASPSSVSVRPPRPHRERPERAGRPSPVTARSGNASPRPPRLLAALDFERSLREFSCPTTNDSSEMYLVYLFFIETIKYFVIAFMSERYLCVRSQGFLCNFRNRRKTHRELSTNSWLAFKAKFHNRNVRTVFRNSLGGRFEKRKAAPH